MTCSTSRSTGPFRLRFRGKLTGEPEHFTLLPGKNVLSWSYAKDPSLSMGMDAGWLAQVVYIVGLPVITQEPQGQVAPVGTSFRLTVQAAGQAPLAYQWLKAGTNLPNATAAYLTILNATRHDSGDYQVVVTDSAGSVLSSNAQVVVRVPQRLGPVAWLPGGEFMLLSRDADGAALWQSDLAGFEAQVSTNLTDWSTLNARLTLTNGELLLLDPQATNYAQQFYRIVEP